jgi:hypothetical protein
LNHPPVGLSATEIMTPLAPSSATAVSQTPQAERMSNDKCQLKNGK